MKANFRNVIYHAFDTSNGKAYVGQTWEWPYRKKQHLKGNSYFDRALRKRPQTFVWTILVSDLENQQELDRAEDAFILEFKTIHPLGYNIRRGGSRGKMHEDSKEKCRKANIGRHAGDKNPMFGKPGTCLGRVGEKHPLFGKKGILCKNSKKVVCNETGDVFSSLKEAADFVGVTSSIIARICQGLQKSTKGFSFSYENNTSN